jgi:hypothetical protein
MKIVDEFVCGDRVSFTDSGWEAEPVYGTVIQSGWGVFAGKTMSEIEVSWDTGDCKRSVITLPDARVQKLNHAAKREVRVVLHTSNGDVVTAFPRTLLKAAEQLIISYLVDGKKFSVE